MSRICSITRLIAPHYLGLQGVLATALQEHVAGFRVWTWVSTHFSGDGSKGHSRLALILRAIIFCDQALQLQAVLRNKPVGVMVLFFTVNVIAFSSLYPLILQLGHMISSSPAEISFNSRK